MYQHQVNSVCLTVSIFYTRDGADDEPFCSMQERDVTTATVQWVEVTADQWVSLLSPVSCRKECLCVVTLSKLMRKTLPTQTLLPAVSTKKEHSFCHLVWLLEGRGQSGWRCGDAGELCLISALFIILVILQVVGSSQLSVSVSDWSRGLPVSHWATEGWIWTWLLCSADCCVTL